MTIAPVSSSGTLQVANILQIRGTAGRVALPVAPAFAVYARFKNIVGFPAQDGSDGIPLSKLRVLDTMLSRLSDLGKGPDSVSFERITPDTIDGMIRAASQRIETVSRHSLAVRFAPATGFGQVIDILA